jgi:hypothetical protein
MNTLTAATLTIGGVSGTFNVTTTMTGAQNFYEYNNSGFVIIAFTNLSVGGTYSYSNVNPGGNIVDTITAGTYDVFIKTGTGTALRTVTVNGITQSSSLSSAAFTFTGVVTPIIIMMS